MLRIPDERLEVFLFIITTISLRNVRTLQKNSFEDNNHPTLLTNLDFAGRIEHDVLVRTEDALRPRTEPSDRVVVSNFLPFMARWGLRDIASSANNQLDILHLKC